MFFFDLSTIFMRFVSLAMIHTVPYRTQNGRGLNLHQSQSWIHITFRNFSFEILILHFSHYFQFFHIPSSFFRQRIFSKKNLRRDFQRFKKRKNTTKIFFSPLTIKYNYFSEETPCLFPLIVLNFILFIIKTLTFTIAKTMNYKRNVFFSPSLSLSFFIFFLFSLFLFF